jgi:hypothetical protein
MYPHGRSLVKRLESKPFALLGVNSDSDKEKLRDVMRKEGITWRSWWDGGRIGGPIASRWNVVAWPTVYILDARGVIRYKYNDVSAKELDDAVDTLLEEVERRKP